MFYNLNGHSEGEFFELLLEASNSIIWILNESGDIVHQNPSARLLFEAASAATPWQDRWPEACRHYTRRAVSDALEGRPATLRLRLPQKDRPSAYFHVKLAAAPKPGGLPIRLLARAEDVTDAVEREAFLRTVLDTLPSGLTVRDAITGRYVLSNRAADAIFSRPEGLVGLSSHEVLPPDVARWESDESSGPSRAKLTFPAPDATCPDRHLSALRAATYDDEGVRHVISLIEDVTERRRAEEALHQAGERSRKAEQARNTFLSLISHELRTPLNGLIGGLDLLEDKDETGEVLAMMRASASSLHRLLDDLIETVDGAADKDTIETLPIDPRELLEEVASRHRARALAKNLRIIVESADLLRLNGDRRRLVGVLDRLTDNAVKFSTHGEVRLAAAALTGGAIRFSVMDDGPGFALAEKARLFEGFHQADQGLTRRHGGLGLGLPLAQSGAEALGGAVDAALRPEGGAHFWLDVPARLTTTTNKIEHVGERLRILVADDHPANRLVVEMMTRGFADVVGADDGAQAVSTAAESAFDLILMDIQMPRLDGISAVAKIRSLEAARGLPPTPILMLTANTQADYIEASRSAGADGHIGKPFTATTLLGAIRDILMNDPVRSPPLHSDRSRKGSPMDGRSTSR